MRERGTWVVFLCVLALVTVAALPGCKAKEAEKEKTPGATTEAETAPATPGGGTVTGETEKPPLTEEEADLIRDVAAKDDWKEATPAAEPAAEPVPAAPTKPGKPLPAVVRRCAEAPTLDGKLDDACWKSAAVEGVWIDVYTGVAAKVQPKAFVCYDDRNLYVAFLNPEPDMKNIVADADTRDGQTWTDDSNELFIDPTAGRKDYFQFIVNTRGVLYDGHGRDGDWDSKTTVKVHKGEKEWSVELAIPLSALEVPGSPKGQTWTVNFCRNRQVTGEAEALAWSDTGESFHNPEAFGKLKME